ncbi:MAG: radical SAM protein [Oscillospiraceae bacterium]|jgi:hypothetical protein|nr:radical SAM protein [Oscillospiraceae bacterium]
MAGANETMINELFVEKADTFRLERISLILLLGCNLKCKHCCVQAPYYERKYYPTLDFIKREIDATFTIADCINYFSVEGGEVFLRKDLALILTHLSQYVDKIGVEAPVITNGSFLPGRDVIGAAKLFGEKIRFIIDDYGVLSPNAHEMAKILRDEGIRCDLRNYDDNPYCGGWVDLYGDYGEKHSADAAEAMFLKCAWAQKLHGVFEIIGGLFYFCPASRVFSERNRTENEAIDFLAKGVSLQEIRARIQAWFEGGAISACRFCNGIHDHSERKRPAVQLTAGEETSARLSTFRYRENLGEVL